MEGMSGENIVVDMGVKTTAINIVGNTESTTPLSAQINIIDETPAVVLQYKF